MSNSVWEGIRLPGNAIRETFSDPPPRALPGDLSWTMRKRLLKQALLLGLPTLFVLAFPVVAFLTDREFSNLAWGFIALMAGAFLYGLFSRTLLYFRIRPMLVYGTSTDARVDSVTPVSGEDLYRVVITYEAHGQPWRLTWTTGEGNTGVYTSIMRSGKTIPMLHDATKRPRALRLDEPLLTPSNKPFPVEPGTADDAEDGGPAVDLDAVAAALGAPPPREMSDAVRARALETAGVGRTGYVVAAALVCIGAIIVGLAATSKVRSGRSSPGVVGRHRYTTYTDHTSRDDRPETPVFILLAGIALVPLGGLAALSVWRRRRRVVRLLRRGRFGKGVVAACRDVPSVSEKAKEDVSSFTIALHAVSRIVAFTTLGKKHECEAKVALGDDATPTGWKRFIGREADIALKRNEDGDAVGVLFDPDHPDRLLLVDALAPEDVGGATDG